MYIGIYNIIQHKKNKKVYITRTLYTIIHITTQYKNYNITSKNCVSPLVNLKIELPEKFRYTFYVQCLF